MLEAGALSLVVRAGAGYNTIDVAAASRRGIYVFNCPGKNAIAVAELAIGLILALDRRIPDNVAELRAGKWNKKEFSKARGLFGSTLGLIGYGNIGQEVAGRRPGDLVCRWWSGAGALPTGASSPICRSRSLPSPEDVADVADIVSVHLALSKDTRGLLGDAFFARMKRGAIFINTARGEVVDYAALERGDSRARDSRGPRRFPGRAGRRDGRFQHAARDAAAASTARITSAVRPIRRRKRSPPRRCASSRRT